MIKNWMKNVIEIEYYLAESVNREFATHHATHSPFRQSWKTKMHRKLQLSRIQSNDRTPISSLVVRQKWPPQFHSRWPVGLKPCMSIKRLHSQIEPYFQGQNNKQLRLIMRLCSIFCWLFNNDIANTQRTYHKVYTEIHVNDKNRTIELKSCPLLYISTERIFA